MLELAQPLWLLLLPPVAGWIWLAWHRTQGESPAVVLNHPGLPLSEVGRLPALSLRVPVVLRGMAMGIPRLVRFDVGHA